LPFFLIAGFGALRVCIFDPYLIPGGEGGKDHGELGQEDGKEGK